MSEKKLFLLDAFALIYRAHFAMSQNPRLTTNGINTGAILGFTNSLLEIITKEKPSHIGVAFDTHAPTFRHEDYAEYKATRQEQPEEIKVAIPYCLKIVEGFNIPILMKDGYEADDLIGTIAKKASKEGFKVYMMTPDKDFAQLVDENIFLFKPRRMGNGVDIMGIPEVLEKFDIDTVDQVRDVLGLKGDSVDNIPGIPGIGDKTASKLLKEYGSVEEIVAHVDELKGALQKRVQEHGPQGIMSKELATIKIDSPIEFDETALQYGEPNPDILQPIFDKLEFKTIARRVFQEENDIKKGETQQLGLFDGGEDAPAASDNKESIKTTKHNYQLVEGQEAIQQLVKKLSAEKSFCFDTETTSLETREAKLVGIAFAIKKGEAWYVPCGANAQSVADAFKEILENESIQKIGQNLKYDIQVMRNYDVHVKGEIFDTMLAHFLLDPESNNSMDWLADKFLNYKTISFENLVGPKGKNQKTIDQIDPEKVKDYACEDADITLQLKELLEKDIDERKLQKLLHEVEEPLSFVLADMEYEGVKVDTSALEKMSKELDEESRRVQQEIFDIAGVDFNIGSPKQLGEILFDKLKLVEKPKKTKSGQYATGEDILSKLADEHAIAAKILEFREYQKLKSTYVDALPKLISPASDRIHTDYRQTVAATGRLSSNNPNLQNIPIRTEKGREIRKAFIPSDKNHLIMAADYSQIELRIMAAFSKDESMMNAFKEGRDIHATTAAKVFGVDVDNVEPNMRRKAKEVNFGIIYGISAYGLSQNLNIARGEAQEVIDSYFKEFPNVKKYMDETIEKAKKDEFVETILGRRRYLRNINSRNFTMRGFDERNAINAPIQGSAADIIKIAMINTHKWMQQENLKSKMIMQVHDELVFNMHKDEQDLLISKVESFMKNAYPLEVPMEIGIGVGENWLEAH
ncbi:DNA polymerase I [Ekhidna sp. MALMAid0563]|uniref:DNA polymerase I n=1 Tax=Ekhidna sp. MALMAid0563 TaxID=3143937 RepID=UPI0032DE7899